MSKSSDSRSGSHKQTREYCVRRNAGSVKIERVDIDGVRRKARNWIVDPSSCQEDELRQEIQKLLRLKASKRFKIIEIYDVFRKSLDEGKDDFSLIGRGLQNVLKYCRNVMKFPERREYRTIRVSIF